MKTYDADGLDGVLRPLYRDLLAIPENKSYEASRGSCREFRGSVIRIANPRKRLSSSEARGRPFSALAELVWYLSGSNDVDQIARYIPGYRREAEDDGKVHGGYGPRLRSRDGHDPLRDTIERLRAKETSRKAVIPIFEHRDTIGSFKDVPCTTALQFFVREGRLDLVATMRSNDAWLGLPHDVFCFTMLQEIVARSLGAELGDYVHFAASLHLYEENRIAARSYVDIGISDDPPMPPMPIGDPWPALDELVELEKELRADPATGIRHSDPYWRDLALLLQAHLTPDLSETGNLHGEVETPLYANYIQEREVRRKHIAAKKERKVS